jgi:NAD(P)-dependent dehydrogenase (short-subunit alcohol dehydrogenase family)
MGYLDGKVAIVTGAGRGIGREEALLLAGEGASVVVNDLGGDVHGGGSDVSAARAIVAEIEGRGGTAVANHNDISTWAGAEAVINQAVHTYGEMNILVNNAGILRDGMSFNLGEDDWDSVMRVHLKGHFATSHFAAMHWRTEFKAGNPTSGRIVNTSSDSGLWGNPGQSNYAAAKAGIVSLTWVLARELARFGVTVNAVVPRARTRLTATIGFDDQAVDADGGYDKLAPEHVAPVVGWLASDESAETSGQVFIVNGTEIMLIRGFSVAGSVDRPSERVGETWTVGDLADSSAAMFGEIGPGIAPLEAPNW